MKTINNYKAYQDIIDNIFRSYEKQFNSQEKNIEEGWEVTFNIIMDFYDRPVQKDNEKETYHKVAYFRVSRTFTNKNDEKKGSHSLLYHNSYNLYKKTEEITEKNKYMLLFYQDLFARLIAGGIEYAESLRQMKEMNERSEAAKVEALTKEDTIQTTKEMPKPLSEDEKAYKKQIDKLRKEDGQETKPSLV